MSLCFPSVKLREYRQDRIFALPNEAQIWLAGLDDKERVDKILGTEFVTMYYNEASQIPYSSYLVASTRLAQVCDGIIQREYFDLNPGGTAHWTCRMFVQKVNPASMQPLSNPDNYRLIYINPADNRENLSDGYLQSLDDLPERQRKRFRDGAFTADIDNALWTLETIDQCRVDPEDLPQMQRIVVAVDPSGTSGPEDKRSDHIGIVVAGLGIDGNAYVIADYTCQLSPAGWARTVIGAYHTHSADRIIGEVNYGGAMVEHVIKSADGGDLVSYKEVTATRGKVIRAEPISVLYEKKRIRHAGRFAELEDQLANFSTLGYVGDKSPDRADAMIWAMTELFGTGIAVFESEPLVFGARVTDGYLGAHCVR